MKKDDKDVFGSKATTREKEEMERTFGATKTPRERAAMVKEIERRSTRKAKR
jgi:hypothetical protein